VSSVSEAAATAATESHVEQPPTLQIVNRFCCNGTTDRISQTFLELGDQKHAVVHSMI